jgi:hypothetical protein
VKGYVLPTCPIIAIMGLGVVVGVCSQIGFGDLRFRNIVFALQFFLLYKCFGLFMLWAWILALLQMNSFWFRFGVPFSVFLCYVL